MFYLIFSAITLSLDGFAAGIIFGLRKLKISISARIWIAIFSSGFTGVSLFVGDYLGNSFSFLAGKIIGAVLLCFLGGFQIWRVFFPKLPKASKATFLHTFRLWGLTIQIMREPIKGDLNGSGVIEAKEAFFLGLSLSIDMLGAGVGLALSGLVNWMLIPIIGIVQSFGLWIGEKLGQKIGLVKFSRKVSSILSGILLCLLGVMRLL